MPFLLKFHLSKQVGKSNIILGCGKCNLLVQSLLQNHPPLLGGAGREELDLDLFLQTDNKLNSNLMGT